MPTIRVELPTHLRTLAQISGHEVSVEVPAPATVRLVLDALEAAYPMLCGTIREHATLERRAFLRFFACQQDLSLDSQDAPLPAAVVNGREPLIILGAVAGGTTAVDGGGLPIIPTLNSAE
jgi:molybdopterin synthase sulfur carrier subunit